MEWKFVRFLRAEHAIGLHVARLLPVLVERFFIGVHPYDETAL